jgi:hypothetical protein
MPNAPRLLKAALITYDLPDPSPVVILFQYNPGTLTRTIQPNMGEGSTQGDVARFRGAPRETISLEIELDAADFGHASQGSRSLGLHPRLAALERLLYPPSQHVIANHEQLALGLIEIIPPPAPFTLFVFGPRRILPVRLTQLTVTEETHDPDLNPLQARVSLGMQVITYDDLPPKHRGSAVFLAHQVAKELLSAQASVNTLNSVTGGNVRIF